MEYEVKESTYLKSADVKNIDNVTIEILSEARDVKTDWGMKPQCEAKVTFPAGIKNLTYQLNQPTINYLVAKYGKDSKSWIGKSFGVTTKFIKGNDAIIPKS